jgi:hypothetical protein
VVGIVDEGPEGSVGTVVGTVVDLHGEGLEGTVGTVDGSEVEGEGPEGSVGTVVGAVVEGEGPEGSVGTVVGTVVEGKGPEGSVVLLLLLGKGPEGSVVLLLLLLGMGPEGSVDTVVGRSSRFMSPTSATISDPKVPVESPDRLRAFLRKHPEMRFKTEYDPSYAWSMVDVLELHGILSEVDKHSELGCTFRYRNAKKFYRHLSQVFKSLTPKSQSR